MKLNKERLTEALLNEEDNVAEIIPDVDSASTDEIADVVQQDIEAESEGEITLSDKEAENTATDIKDVDKKIDDSVFVSTASENALTKVLDEALRTTLKSKRQAAQRHTKKFEGSNVLITGLPGSGKTAVVYDWASHNNVHIMYLDAKNNDLEAYINGYTLKDATKPGENVITQGYSDNLEPLERENSILFLDELNRQTKVNIRGSLYSLINEHVIAGKDDEGRRYFPNLLFTIACINPSVPSDKGASPLSDAELSRFDYKLDFDSDTETAEDYFTKHYNDSIKALNKNDEYYAEDYVEYKMEQELALFIVTHQDFKFDSRDDLDDLAGDYLHPKTMLNLRSLSKAISISKGRKNEFLNYIKNYSEFLERDKNMFSSILSSYSDPEIKIENNPELAAIKNKSSENEYESDDFEFSGIDLNDETDISLFNTQVPSVPSAKAAISPMAAKQKLANFNF